MARSSVGGGKTHGMLTLGLLARYPAHRKPVILQYLTRFQHSLPTWQTDAKAAALLAGALENDH